MLRLFLFALFCNGVALLRFDNGSYTEVIVAFDRGWIRSKEQVDNLENLIKVASRVLYNATDGLAYFKEVRIILTHKKEHFGSDEIAKRSVLFSRADIRIGSPNAEYGTPDAFTLQMGECGEQGKFIFLSDSLFEDLGPSENAITFAARRLVQEWVRYRYGVFGEQESFQWEGNQISPATCADGIKGWAMTEYHERCVLECGRVRSSCRFFPDPKRNPGMVSSLMSYPHLANVKFFCNGSNHNRKASSMHNRMCNSKSIMEVIREHEDFKDTQQWLDTRMEGPPEETVVIRVFDDHKELFVFFVVEWSEMMEKANGTQEVQHFIVRVFEHLAPRRTAAYYIKFSNEIEKLWTWSIEYKDIWQNFGKLNVSKPVGSPSDTPDIDEALEEASKYGWYFPMIILISTGDGKIDEGEQYKSWEDNKLLTIHSIVIGRNVSWKVDRLSQMHGGDSYFLGDAESRERGEPRTFNLDMAFLASMHAVAGDHERPVVICYERFTLKKGKRYNHSFHVDDEIGKDLAVTFSPNQTMYELLNPRLRSPPQKTHQYGYGSNAKSIFVDGAEPGRWTLELWQDSKQEEDYVDIMITAKLRTNCSLQGSCVLVRAWIANVTEDEKGNGTKGYHRIYAEVKRGFNPVIDAKVEATVQIMDQPDPINVTLKDNGGAPDVLKDDGIYSNFFPVTERPAGRPIVIVRVTNNDGKAGTKIASYKKGRSTHGILDAGDRQKAVKRFGKSTTRFSAKDFATYSRTRSYCKQRKATELISSMALPLFERVAMSNSPILFALNKHEVLKTPPAAILDLKVVGEFKKEDGFSVLLQWTSPEHPRPMIKVGTIEVCGSRNQNSVTSKECPPANTIYNISRGIAPAGEIQQFEVNIPSSMLNDSAGKVHNLYFALRARDRGGNTGGMSNVAEAFFGRFDVEGIKGKEKDDGRKEDDERDESVKEEARSRSWVPWTVGTVVVIVIAVVGAIGYLMWKNKKNKGGMPNARVTFQQKENE